MNQAKIIRLKAVMTLTGLSKTTVYRLSDNKQSDFPARVRLSEHAVGWRESEVLAWVESRQGVAA